MLSGNFLRLNSPWLENEIMELIGEPHSLNTFFLINKKPATSNFTNTLIVFSTSTNPFVNHRYQSYYISKKSEKKFQKPEKSVVALSFPKLWDSLWVRIGGTSWTNSHSCSSFLLECRCNWNKNDESMDCPITASCLLLIPHYSPPSLWIYTPMNND